MPLAAQLSESAVKHLYRGVLGLGNVAVSRHAQERMVEANISEAMV
jgi:hypothetical protein